MKNGQFPEIIKLGDLNGQNGFKLDGENNGDDSGISVSVAGDINGDGYNDLLIGAPAYLSGSGKGRSYAVFGGSGVGKSGNLLLSSLNGTNGFKLDGENNVDFSGNSVSTAGDINGDGYNDLLIGANGYPSNSRTGRSYVVFGGPGVGKGDGLLLASLNGTNGFKLDGENNYDYSGYLVSAVGDINGDGYNDLLVGASGYPSGSFTGRSYVVFGVPGVGKSGNLLLSNLNGTNGFKLDGESNGDWSGYSVSAAGDINGDGCNDLLIGALGYPSGSNKGRSYVVFGVPGVGKSGDLLLSSLNGTNGFKLDGENNGDNSGQFVSAAGDINGDGHADLLIGAYGYPSGSNKGRSYVVFGGPGVGQSGDLLLSSLNGANGFKLDGENNNDYSGSSVSAVGDINGDGYADVVIGADGYPSGAYKGRSYMVFGGPEVGQSGNLLLSSLNGANGFKLDGENNNDYSGFSVSAVGDINGDSVDDLLIGARGYLSGSNKGRTYVVFGDVPPVLVNNSLNLYSGEALQLTTEHLAAYDLNHDNHTLLFVSTAVTHGQFESVALPGVALNNFTQQAIIDQTIQFIHDGSSEAPAYNITVRSDGIAWTGPYPANITFETLLINANQLVINQGQEIIFTANNLQATYQCKVDDSVSFLIANLEHGRFEWTTIPGQAILTFQQQNITDEMVRFVHDGTDSAPAYQVSVSQGSVSTPFQTASIDFDANPVLLNNRLMINQGQSVALTSETLSANHPGSTDDSELRFDISAVQQGQFSWISSPQNPLTSFYQQNITVGLVQFVHDNSTLVPAYNVTVTDSRTSSLSQAAEIDFDAFPILQNNTLRIIQGETMMITASSLSATHPTGDDSILWFNITDVAHGQFEWVTSPGIVIAIFQQQNITDHLVQFVHDNSTSAPAYRVVVSDGRLTTTPAWSLIDFDLPPVLINNQLTIGQYQTITFTTENLLATHNSTAEPSLIFMISNIMNGGFIVSKKIPLNPSPVPEWGFAKGEVAGNLTFLQQQVLDQEIHFLQQGSGKPAYQVSVTDGRITLPLASANVTFYVKPVLTQNQFLVSTGQSALLTSANLAATRAGEIAEDLQFLVSSVSHGRFEKRNNPGVEVLFFYQKDVMQQSIQFVADNSTQIPDCRLKVWDSSTDLASDIQETGIILVANNYFRINQGYTVPLTEEVLKATGNRGDDGDILFTPILGTVQHGQFELLSNPDYPLMNFQQKQITANEIVFVSENTTSTPSAFLTISNGQPGDIQGTVACQIDFDAAPWLQNTYLSTYSGDRSSITDINLKATSPTANINELVFEISEITHGYFADKSQWQVDLTNFTQQQVMNGSIIFVADKSGLVPEFKVSVWDGRLHCWACPQSADVVFGGSSPSNSGLSEIIKNAVIGAAVSGVVGLLFFALRYRHSLSLQRNARPMIDGEEQDTYSDALLLPIAREIFSRIKITGCLGYIGKRQYNEYVGAVSVIVAALETKGVIQPETWNSLSRPKKQKIIDAIAMHTKELVGNNRCCSTRTFTGFYRAEATPRMIRDQANAIADAVQETLTDSVEVKSSDHRGVRLTQVSSSLNDNSQLRTSLLGRS